MQGESFVGCIDPIRRDRFLTDTYDRVIPTPLSSHQDKIKLPSFIPGITSGLKLPKVKKDSLVAVSLGEIIGARGNLLVKTIDGVRHRLGLPAESRVALICTGKDSRLEALWKISDSHNIWEQISQIGFEWGTSLTYSVWDEMPRTDQIRNQDRNLQTHDLFANLGLPCIPFLFPFNERDYLAAGEWLRERPDINKVAVLAQYYRKNYQIMQLRKNMHALQNVARRPLEFLVVGVAVETSISSIMEEFQATVVAWKPFHKALSGKRCTEDLQYVDSDYPREELAYRNFEQYYRYCDKLYARWRQAA